MNKHDRLSQYVKKRREEQAGSGDEEWPLHFETQILTIDPQS